MSSPPLIHEPSTPKADEERHFPQDGNAHGPVGRADTADRVRRGLLGPDTLVRTAARGNAWRRVGETSLLPRIAAPPQAPAAAPFALREAPKVTRPLHLRRPSPEVSSSHQVIFWKNPLALLILVAAIPLSGIGLALLLIWCVRARCTHLEVSEGRVRFTAGFLTKDRVDLTMSVRAVRVRQSLTRQMVGTGDVLVFMAAGSPESVAAGMPEPRRVRALLDRSRQAVHDLRCPVSEGDLNVAILAGALALALCVPAHAQTRESRRAAVDNFAGVIASEEACPKWRANPALVTLRLTANGVAPKDVEAGGKYHKEVVQDLATYRANFARLSKHDACDMVEYLFGPRGQILPDLMRLR